MQVDVGAPLVAVSDMTSTEIIDVLGEIARGDVGEYLGDLTPALLVERLRLELEIRALGLR